MYADQVERTAAAIAVWAIAIGGFRLTRMRFETYTTEQIECFTVQVFMP